MLVIQEALWLVNDLITIASRCSSSKLNSKISVQLLFLRQETISLSYQMKLTEYLMNMMDKLTIPVDKQLLCKCWLVKMSMRSLEIKTLDKDLLESGFTTSHSQDLRWPDLLVTPMQSVPELSQNQKSTRYNSMQAISQWFPNLWYLLPMAYGMLWLTNKLLSSVLISRTITKAHKSWLNLLANTVANVGSSKPQIVV